MCTACTGLPTKDETSQTTLVNLYYLYFIFMSPCNFKLFFFFAKSFNKPLKYYILGRRHNLNLESSYFKMCLSSLQSHPMRVTLYARVILEVKLSICVTPGLNGQVLLSAVCLRQQTSWTGQTSSYRFNCY